MRRAPWLVVVTIDRAPRPRRRRYDAAGVPALDPAASLAVLCRGYAYVQGLEADAWQARN